MLEILHLVTVGRLPFSELKKMKIGRNDPCWCGCGRKYKQCHESFDKKLDSLALAGKRVPTQDMIKTPEQIEKIRKSAAINMACLDYVEKNIREGISTEEINEWVNKITYEMGGIPAPLNYEGFPKSVCTSINDEVCHGIPAKDIILKSGDIVNVDCSTILDGYFSDSSRMFMIGDVSKEKQDLVKVAKECCDIGLAAAKPWAHLGDVGAAITEHAHKHGYSIVRSIGGHGVGLEFHEDPWVGYVTKPGTEIIMAPGFMFTIEPMVNMGGYEIFVDDENGWTVYTKDHMPSAQWEYQIVITEDGAEVISR